MEFQEMLAPMLAFKLEHGDYDLTFSIRDQLLRIECKPVNKKAAHIEICFTKSAYGGQGKAGLGDFMGMISAQLGTHV
jgi:hypothetical protein